MPNMIAKTLISRTIPPLKLTDNGAKALAWMNSFHVQHLPVVHHHKYIGLVSEYDILDRNTPTEAFDRYDLDKTSHPSVSEKSHLYAILRTVIENHLTLVPVLDEQQRYMGIITIESLLEHFAHASSLQEPGGIIQLDMPTHRYALSEIAQIVESNGAKVLSSNLLSKPDESRVEVTIKVNRTDLNSILATFERYNYDVLATHEEDNDFMSEAQDNYDSFLNYLNM